MARVNWILILIFLMFGCAEQPVQDASEVDKVLAFKPKMPPAKNKPSPAPAVAPDMPKNLRYYTVLKGDTLYSIGFRSGFGYWKLAEWNHIAEPYRLSVGQKLKLFDPNSVNVAAPPVALPVMPAPVPFVSPVTAPIIAAPKPAASASNNSVTLLAGKETPVISKDKEKTLKLYWQWPIRGTIVRNFAKTSRKGVDIKCQLGDAIHAAADGEVVYSGNGIVAYGNLLIIKHNNDFMSAYANNESLSVQEGQKVNQGQDIARCGMATSGVASLHFEIRKNGKSVDPEFYLPI